MSSLNSNGYGWGKLDPIALSSKAKLISIKIGTLIKKHEIDAIAFAGASGSALAFYLGIEHKLPLMYVRKSGEPTHSNDIVECNTDRDIKNYLIIDDFMCSGDTLTRIIKEISAYANWVNGFYKDNKLTIPECKGIFLYSNNQVHPPFFGYDNKTIPIYA